MTYGTPISLQQAIQVAVDHHQAGRLNEALSVYRQILAFDPTQFDALHLSGVVEHQLGQHSVAVDLITRAISENGSIPAAHHHLGEAYRALNLSADAERSFQAAISLDPAHAEAHNSLAIVYQSQNRTDDAIASFERAIAERPGWSSAYFNLGLALKSQGKTTAAIKAFHDGWDVDGRSVEAASQCVGTLADALREGFEGYPNVVCSGPVDLSFSIVFCSIDDAKCRNATALYERLFANVDHEIIAIRDARSLAEAYNRAVARSRGDIVILSHDDIDILAVDFAARLAGCFDQVDAVGAIGGENIAGPRWSSCDHPHLSGWITHRPQPGMPYHVDLVSPRPRRANMMALDGVFLAARRKVFAKIRFDESTFDGFHLYDIDWTYRASKAGFRLGTAGDLLIVHESRGNFDETWRLYADRFCDKHQVEYRPGTNALFYEQPLDTGDQVRRFFGHLTALDQPVLSSA